MCGIKFNIISKDLNKVKKEIDNIKKRKKKEELINERRNRLLDKLKKLQDRFNSVDREKS